MAPLEIPEFEVPMPERPVLMEIPDENSEAIKVLITNMSGLISYIEELELYNRIKTFYYKNVINILQEGKNIVDNDA